MAKALRCYLCSDLHAANRAYRKLLNAIKVNDPRREGPGLVVSTPVVVQPLSLTAEAAG